MRSRIGLALVVALLAMPAAAHAYVIGGSRWPSHRITYFNADRSMAAAVDLAVRAWNTSGARVRFVPTTRKRADVIIRKKRPPTAGAAVLQGFCQGYSDIGHYKTPEHVDLSPRCAGGLETLAGVAAHELGHILGLDHARGCATMSASVWQFCAPPKLAWQYRCRLLQTDDVRGAVALYGGHVRQKRAFCDTFAAPGAPTDIALGPHQVVVTWQNPPPPRVAYLNLDQPRLQAYIKFTRDTCPKPADATSGYDIVANATPGHQQTVLVPPAANPGTGTWCVSVSIRDQYGRGSTASKIVTIAASPLG